jgi:hypothetical protein
MKQKRGTPFLLSDRFFDGLPERGRICRLEHAELATDEALFNGGEYRLDSRGFEQPGGFANR